jgi:hypothetical protein
MSRTLQFKRYANTVVANTTGAAGELIVETTNNIVTVHTGNTAGGVRMASESYVTNSSSLVSTYAGAAFNSANAASNTASLAFNSANAASNTASLAFNAANTAAQIVPQNAQNTNYTLVASDAGKHLYYTQSSNVTLYIPPSSNTVSFVNGTKIMIVSRTSSNGIVTVTPNTGVSLYLAGNTTSTSRSVTTYGVATLLQVATNTWMISGSGIV